VMREENGRIVLVDFGAASEAADPSRTSYGTPLTTAPEVLRGGLATPAADLWALGVLLYRLTTDHYPIEAKSLGELSQKLHSGEQVPLRDRRPDLPEEFVRVVESALEGDPRRRPSSAEALERALMGQGPAGESEGWLAKAWRSLSGRKTSD